MPKRLALQIVKLKFSGCVSHQIRSKFLVTRRSRSWSLHPGVGAELMGYPVLYNYNLQKPSHSRIYEGVKFMIFSPHYTLLCNINWIVTAFLCHIENYPSIPHLKTISGQLVTTRFCGHGSVYLVAWAITLNSTNVHSMACAKSYWRKDVPLIIQSGGLEPKRLWCWTWRFRGISSLTNYVNWMTTSESKLSLVREGGGQVHSK